ncbi:tetratricopeptide repeat protein [Pedobacter sp. P351]|uniref:tetratricopeptide repeat protein n=1 Tax=Pedobacter superstes TaxID=3133441 RepID=UPI0030B002BF
MNFKSLIFGLLITAYSVSVFAQKSEVASAKESLAKYIQISRSTPKLAESFKKLAKESIDKATVHEKTKADPELWGMRALLYSELAYTDNTSASVNYAAEATAALAKVKELDPEADNKENVKKARYTLYQNQLLKGKKHFDTKDYAAAYTEFNKGLEFLPGDTIINYYAGVSAQNTKNYKAAIKNYTDLLSTNFSFLPDVYTNLAEAYAADKDTAAAIKVLTEGFAKFPKSNQLISREIELSINSGRYKEVISKIESQVQSNPTNPNFPFFLGIAYASLNDVTKSEEAYKKAIAIDPKFMNAYINLGSLIMNSGIDTYNAANKKYANKALNAAQLAEYNAVKKKATAEFDRALPFLLKATEIDPKSKMAWTNLRAYYNAKSNKAKVTEIDAKLSAL